jgi:hypothetical protein
VVIEATAILPDLEFISKVVNLIRLDLELFANQPLKVYRIARKPTHLLGFRAPLAPRAGLDLIRESRTSTAAFA